LVVVALVQLAFHQKAQAAAIQYSAQLHQPEVAAAEAKAVEQEPTAVLVVVAHLGSQIVVVLELAAKDQMVDLPFQVVVLEL
jgi:ABC-type hemin transport system substrate-binding protein